MPSMPEGAREGIRRGMPVIHEAANAKVRLLGAGTILNETLAAADLLEKDWGVGADVFSVTSFTELRREGMEASRRRRVSPSPLGEGRGEGHGAWVEMQLPKT